VPFGSPGMQARSGQNFALNRSNHKIPDAEFPPTNTVRRHAHDS
jgi:predicted nucleic acid-binding protein/Arc/MetJ family transcription regulator